MTAMVLNLTLKHYSQWKFHTIRTPCRWSQFRSYSVIGYSIFFYIPFIFVTASSISATVVIFINRKRKKAGN